MAREASALPPQVRRIFCRRGYRLTIRYPSLASRLASRPIRHAKRVHATHEPIRSHSRYCRQSLRRQSYNRAALRAAAQLVPEGSTLDIFELDGIPGFNQDDDETPPAAVVELKRRVREADAVLFATPEYNYSVPGVLKNAIDWASRPYGDSARSGKPAAIMGASIGRIGTARAQYYLPRCSSF
jgi:hypothetical protein